MVDTMVKQISTSKSRTLRPHPSTPQPTIPVNEPTNQPFSSGVRKCLGRGKGVHVAIPTHFEGHLNFSKATDKQRYAMCC